MQRLDPQDSGSAYRNAIGLPGGTESPLYPIVEELNTAKMPLLVGKGEEKKDEYVVWIYDSNRFPFFRAEPIATSHPSQCLHFRRFATLVTIC